MVLGEMLMGIDFDGDEPGDDSKCILKALDSVRGGSVYVYTHDRALSAVNSFARSVVFTLI
jgi:hypothetical protein